MRIASNSTRFSAVLRSPRLRSLAPLVALAVAGCGSKGTDAVGQGSSAATATPMGISRIVTQDTSLGASGTSSLTYYGGPVLSNVKVVAVVWGSNVNSSVVSELSGFYSAITNSGYIDSLSEYGTPTQQIGRGSLAGQYTISPNDTKTAISGDDVANEIAAQVNANRLPAPDKNTLYMVHFPPGISIDGESCVTFCAYHTATTKQINGASTTFYFGVVPDFGAGSGCDVGCGGGTMIENIESVSSHEVVEAITDPDVSTGWQDRIPGAPGGEIGDLCNHQHGVLFSGGANYTVQHQWSNQAGYCAVDADPRAIDVSSAGYGLLDVFYRAPDNTLHTDRFDGTHWSGDTALGGPVDSAPSSAQIPTGASVFARGTDEALYTKTGANGIWPAGFSGLGGPFDDSPTAISDNGTRVHVFVRGTDGALYWKWSDPSTPFGSYQRVASNPFVGKPSVVSWGANRLDVFVRGTDNELYTISWDGKNWTPSYTRLGTMTFQGDPAAVSWGAGRIDVFVHSTDGTLNTTFWSGGPNWSGYTQLGTEQFLGSPAVASWGAGRLDVFVRGTDNNLYTKSLAGGSWTGYTHLGSEQILGSPAVASWGTNRLDVFVRGTDNNLYTKSWAGGPNWTGYVPLNASLY
ncbi:MAG TPA: hypothetical protein VGI39_27250 [Polyangiaceae bacterium]|jgi:hypothetical protein